MPTGPASPRWLSAVGVALVLAVAAGTALATPLLWRTNAAVAVGFAVVAGLSLRGLLRHWPSWRRRGVTFRARRESNALLAESSRLVARRTLAPEAVESLRRATEALRLALAQDAAAPLGTALAALSAALEPHRRRLSASARLVLALALGLVAAGLVRTFVLGVYRIPTVSMVPALLVGDHLLVDRLAYRSKAPAPGEVVVLERLDDDGQARPYVKRVVAVGGQTVAFEGRSPVVDGVPVVREFVGEAQLDDFGDPARRRSFFFESEVWEERAGERRWQVLQRKAAPAPVAGPFVVPAGQLFVLGDNRDDSTDSRSPAFGTVPLDRVVGRARWVLFSWGGEAGWRGARAALPVR